MRTFMLISLLLLSILVHHEAQGIRLVKLTSLSATSVQKLVHERKGDELRRSNDGLEEANVCDQDSHSCLKSGWNRKLMTKTTFSSSTTTTISKNDKNDHANRRAEGQSKTRTDQKLGEKEENFSVNSSPMTEPYPDIIDIAGMDYSPARRKPPIHN